MRSNNLLAGFLSVFAIVCWPFAEKRSMNTLNAGYPLPIQTKSSQIGSNAELEVITVRFCDLVTRPDHFDGKVIRVQAIYESTWEWVRLYDRSCRTRNNYIRPVFECNTIESCEIVRRTLERDIVGNPFKGQRVGITAIGRFRSASKSTRKFGVLGGFRFQLEIARIENTNRL